MEVLAVFLTPLFFLPALTGYYASSHGLSFWRWFLIGCGLPYVSLLIVAAVVHRDQRRKRALSTAPSLVEEQKEH